MKLRANPPGGDLRTESVLSGRPATSVFVRVNIGAQNRVHAREMALALSLEPLEHVAVAVNAQMHGGLRRMREQRALSG